MWKPKLIALLLLGLVGCAKQQPQPQAATTPGTSESKPVEPAAKLPEKLTADHLPNPVKVHERVISGGLPEGDEAFAELAAMGVKTIISVDGTKPDVATAEKHGMRYIHLPHGYDGVPEERGRELAKAVHDLPGPIYIHCHHGKHRSPAAAAVACVEAGLIPHEDALAILKLAGTSENYRGLYESADSARPLGEEALAALTIEFQSTAAIPPLAEAMVAIEHTHDHLKQIGAAGWKAPPDHPALEPAHEALLLREHFTELLRTEEAQKQPAEFRELLTAGETAANELEVALRAEPKDNAAAQAGFDRVTANCAACHKKFRDVPLGEK